MANGTFFPLEPLDEAKKTLSGGIRQLTNAWPMSGHLR
jgi:hypothetical protein